MNRTSRIKRLGIGFALILGAAGICSAGWFDWDSQKIIVVQGTSSLTDATEKPFAGRLAGQVDTWLTDIGAPHKLLTDDDISAWHLWRTRVVILPYNPHPSARALQAYQNVIDSGGILLVCYGMDPSLATLMEVKLGTYQAARSKTQWASFEFDRATLPGLPAQVFQSSQHLIPVFPNSGTAHVIARWLDAQGTRTPDAAWIQSKAGFWMSHVLQPSDDENKRQMLLAMLATVMPDVWDQAVKHQLSLRRPFGEYDSLKTACRALAYPQPPTFRTKKGREAYAAAQVWLSDLTKLYVQRKLTKTFSMKGVWLSDEACPTPDAWPSLEASLVRQKLNTVFLHVGNPLTLQASAPLHDQKATPAIHAWLSCMNLEGASPEQLKNLREQGRLQVSDAGETLNWLCPSHPQNRILLAETATGLARNKGYAGIHLDYIRYMNSSSCYCRGCRQRFEQAIGHPVNQWPSDARSGALASAYRAWRAEQISACVNIMSKAIHDVNPGLQVSAAVYGGTPACFASVGQDWPDWLRRNAVNFVCPMNYKSDLASFQALLSTQSALNYSNRIYPGVGVLSSQSQLSPDQVAAQLISIQNAGFPGFVLFEYNHGMERTMPSYLPVTRLNKGGRSQNE